MVLQKKKIAKIYWIKLQGFAEIDKIKKKKTWNYFN